MQDILLRVEGKVKELLAGEATGHDWYHVKQVRDMSLRIAKVEGGDTELIELAALAHDVGDRKFFGSEAEGEAVTRKVLSECGVDSEMLEKVMDIVNRVSFKGAGVLDDMPTLEGKIVQDADRLYALGAIGIARTFAYGWRLRLQTCRSRRGFLVVPAGRISVLLFIFPSFYFLIRSSAVPKNLI